MAESVRIVEVGPRDGLQNVREPVSLGAKLRFVQRLLAAGHRHIEVSAFVSPRAIPQLADADALCGLLGAAPEGVIYSALVPNARGADRACQQALGEWAVFTAASETFNQKNTGASIEASFERFAPVAAAAQQAGVRLRGYVSTVLHCPFEGRIAVADTVSVVRRLFELGCAEVSLGETIGKATPGEVRELLAALASEGLTDALAGHFHDTYGMAVANVLVALEAGLRVFDAASGGLGGCPYAPGAAGNAATEDLLWLFHGLGLNTGVSLDDQVRASRGIATALGRRLPSATLGAVALSTG